MPYQLGGVVGKGKITVTIDEDLVRELDRAARTTKVSRSKMVETAVRAWTRNRLEQRLIEGYRAMADEDLKVAERSLPAGSEVLK